MVPNVVAPNVNNEDSETELLKAHHKTETMTSTGKDFDANDPKWSVDIEKFKPDKEDTWKYPMEDDGWMHAHNCLRAELEVFEDALKATLERLGGMAPSEWEIACMNQFWDGHAKHVHSHHHNEDDIMNPFLRTKFNYPEKMEADHVVLMELMDKCEKLTKELSTKDKDCVANLLKAWQEYRGVMEAHLKEEEVVGIPLMRKYFEHHEIGQMVQKILSKKDAPKEEMGSFIHFQGEDNFRNKFMPQEGIPSFVWYIEFKGLLKYYRSQIISQVDALKSGSPPPPPESSCPCSIM